MSDIATGEILAGVIDGAVEESHAKVPKAVPVKGDENDRQEAAFRWAPEDREHAQAEKIDRLEREAAAAMRDNERLRKQVELERDETIAALQDAEALRAALRTRATARRTRARGPWPPTPVGRQPKLGRLRLEQKPRASASARHGRVVMPPPPRN